LEPIVLVHGYSAESTDATPDAITRIYGSLPQALKDAYGGEAVVEIDLSRYLSLKDGLSVDDISRAFDRVLHAEFPALLTGRFHVIAHSTGALVVRNWLRRFSGRPSPILNLIHLAGASFGSGWAHIGKGQIAKWGRKVFAGGAERGIKVLSALELGSSWAIDLHHHFLTPGNTMGDYGVQEYVVAGSQADVRWFEIPIRYAKEDGSDGVVRVSASNVNFQYVRFGPTPRALALTWEEADAECRRHLEDGKSRRDLYEIREQSRPGESGRPEVPFAIPFQCAHSGEEMGIVVGRKPRKQVLKLVRRALETHPADGPARLAEFAAETAATYELAKSQKTPAWWEKWIQEPHAQYDRHAQVVVRLCDQDGRPIESFDVFFDSVKGRNDPSLPLGDLMEDKHVNSASPNVITFYLRTDAWDAKKKDWVPRVPLVRGCQLEISATEPNTPEIVYLPMRFDFSAEVLTRWIVGHRTTVIDVELLRLPAPAVYRMVRFP
jgi:hypothetical protein